MSFTQSLYWLNKEIQEQRLNAADLAPESEEWMNQELHLFIVTDAGKPVYSRYGTVQKLSPILCTCVAILGHMESLNEELNHFRAGNHTFVFLPKQPFVFIAVSKSSLPVSYLFKQLRFLYSLFLSIFSENLINQLSARPSCDFRQIAEGTRPAWDGVVNNMSEDPAFVFVPAIPVSYYRAASRADVIEPFKQLTSCKLSLLMYRNRVLAVGNCDCDSLSFRLICDLMWTPAFQNGESFSPFFARDSTDGMYHLYINKHKKSDYCVVMLCSDGQALFDYHGVAEAVFKRLTESPPPLPQFDSPFYFFAILSVQHGQVFVTDPDPEFFTETDPAALNAKIQELNKQLSKSCDMVGTNGVDGEYMFRGEEEVVVVSKTAEREIYGIARSKDIPDERVTDEMNSLKAYINANINELIIPEYKFPAPLSFN